MSQTIILDRTAAVRDRTGKTPRLAAVITGMKLRIFKSQAKSAKMPEEHCRTICRPEPGVSFLQHPHVDPFLQRIDR
jgi:hypothetical protein